MLAQIAKAATLFLGVIVLSRLLEPVEFGIVAIPIALVGIAEILRDLGLSSAAMTYPDLSLGLRDLLFWVNVAIALLLSVVLILFSGQIATVFDKGAIGDVLPWLTLVFVFNGIGAQYRADLTRRMKFGALALADATASLVAVFGAILLAGLGASYWALIAQQIINSGVAVFIMIIAARWLPKLPRRAQGAGSLLKFGLSVSWSQALMYAGNNIDVLALGIASSTRQVGFYNRAFQVAVQPFVILKQPATSVALPLLSRRSGDTSAFTKAAVEGQKIVAYTIVALAFTLAACAEPAVRVVLGAEWLPAAPAIALLALGSGLQQLVSVSNWMMLARQRGAALRRYSLVSLALKVLFVVPFAQWGATAVAAGYLGASIVAAPIALVWGAKSAGVPVSALLRGISRPVAVVSLAGIVAWGAVYLTDSVGGAWNLAIGISVYMLVMGITTLDASVRADLRGIANVLFRRSAS